MDFNAQTFWYESKAWFRDITGLSTDNAHVHLGLGLFLLGIVIFRRFKHRLAFSWLALFGIQTLNEIMDARDWVMWTGTVNWPELARDYALTLFWPSILWLILPRLPQDVSK